jgi:hypothetical protein
VIAHQVTVYSTEDGERFFSESEAQAHEERLKLKKVMDEYLIYGNEVSDLTGLLDALIEWKHS